MDNKKFEKLIDLIINENEEQASELFHDIVIEKSKAIYESIMEDEMMDDDDLDEGIGGQVGDLLDEINAEEQGVKEEDEIDVDSEEVFDIGGDDEEVEGSIDIEANSSDEVEDAVIRIEDKLDDLCYTFQKVISLSGSDYFSTQDISIGEPQSSDFTEWHHIDAKHDASWGFSKKDAGCYIYGYFPLSKPKGPVNYCSTTKKKIS